MKKNLIIGASLVVTVLMLFSAIPFSTGAPINPSIVWGDIWIDGVVEDVSTHTMTV